MKKELILIGAIVCSTIGNTIFAAECPLIFLHGHKSSGKPSGSDGGWTTWNSPSHTAMMRIINVSYGGYRWGLKADGTKQMVDRNNAQGLKSPEVNAKVILLEWLGGAALSSLSYFLSMQLMPEEGWDDPAGMAIIALTEITLGAPLSAMIGTTLIGEKFDQHGSLWRCALGSLIGSWTAFFVMVMESSSSDKTGLGLVIGSSVGALIGYNLGGVK